MNSKTLKALAALALVAAGLLQTIGAHAGDVTPNYVSPIGTLIMIWLSNLR